MRFRIVYHPVWKGWALYQIRLRGTEVSVRCPSLRRQFTHNERLVWTWWDGTEYALVVPKERTEQTRLLHVFSGDKRICSGHWLTPAFQQVSPGGAVRLVEWELDGQVVVCEGGALCCKTFPRTLTLRQRDGKRLAFWVMRCGGDEGVLRESLPEHVLPVILGMILPHVYDWGDGVD